MNLSSADFPHRRSMIRLEVLPCRGSMQSIINNLYVKQIIM
jgi:hypothetical protein